MAYEELRKQVKCNTCKWAGMDDELEKYIDPEYGPGYFTGYICPHCSSEDIDEFDFKPGEPCNHPGCLSHISHPCEGCGRIGGFEKAKFQPEYFSGLNWREAEKLVGKEVEFSQDAERWSQPRVLTEVKHTGAICRYQREDKEYWTYIRTTPETFKHPTITIGDKELPRPEIEVPEKNTHYFFLRENTEIHKAVWWGTDGDYKRLTGHSLHLTEDRAQAWADWWQETVIKAVDKC